MKRNHNTYLGTIVLFAPLALAMIALVAAAHFSSPEDAAIDRFTTSAIR